MRAIMVMFDSLNRRYLPNYGCNRVHAPNFKRLGEKCVTFDNFYAGSLPCMPARRELHTGRYNFLHRSWSPLEPFDDSMPEILKNNGIHTRLISDHDHYWEDGGSTYHPRYSSWECVRGQEADQWSERVEPPTIPDHVPTMREFTHPNWWEHSFKNKEKIRETGLWPQDIVFQKGLDFLEKNKNTDNWFLQIETFDPHEPFDSPQEFRSLYEDSYRGRHFDWPPYAPVTETDEEVDHIRKRYASLLSMCDNNLGKILDFMDNNALWNDTMLIINTDHGFFLGEKEWWAKSVMPCYNEIAHTPFFLWDPTLKVKGEHRQSLAQTIDIPATLLNYFGVESPRDMEGHSLAPIVQYDTPIRKYGLFGYHGSFTNITDGHNYTYMRSSTSLANEPLCEYTLTPTKQQGFISAAEFAQMETAEAFSFTKGCRVMKIPCASRLKNATFCNSFQYGHLLWDLRNDPEQKTSLNDPETEAELINAMIILMKKNDAPPEQYERMGLDPEKLYDRKSVLKDRTQKLQIEEMESMDSYEWSDDAKNIFTGMLALIPSRRNGEFLTAFHEVMQQSAATVIERKHLKAMAHNFYSDDENKVFYFIHKLSRRF